MEFSFPLAHSDSLSNLIGQKEYSTQLFPVVLEIEVPIKFAIRCETIAKILKSESYKNSSKDKNFLDNKISRDTLALHLMSIVNGAIFSARLKLKNRISMQIPEGQTGRIYWSEKDGLCISFAIRAQNGFGNMIISEVISTDRITILTNQ